MATAEATSEPTTPRKDFFVSYNRADRAWAEWIAWQLEEADYTTVLQAWDFGPGSNFVVEMDRAAREAVLTIAVLSPDYLTSLYTRPEWAAAFAQDPTGIDRRLVPVRVRECTLTGLLAQVVYLDLLGLAEPAAKAALRLRVEPRGRDACDRSDATEGNRLTPDGLRPGGQARQGCHSGVYGRHEEAFHRTKEAPVAIRRPHLAEPVVDLGRVELPDVRLRTGQLVIAPLRTSVPPEAEELGRPA